MKFRPTIVKIIASVLSGIALYFIIIETKIFARPGKCFTDAAGQTMCVDFGPSQWPIYIAGGAIILTYIIWSLITKNKSKNSNEKIA